MKYQELFMACESKCMFYCLLPGTCSEHNREQLCHGPANIWGRTACSVYLPAICSW